MNYHVLRRSVKSGKKSVYRWYYSFIDPATGVKKQKVIPSCHNRAEAYAYIQNLPDLETDRILIKDICKEMFIPGSNHIERLEKHGKKLQPETIRRHRTTLDKITEQFGNYELRDLTVVLVDDFLSNDKIHTGSWKNSFLETLSYVYKEAPFHGCTDVIKPVFHRFSRDSKKADIFTTEELNRFFDYNNWSNKRDYLVLLCMASFGLRMGEARGLQLHQFIPEQFLLRAIFDKPLFDKKQLKELIVELNREGNNLNQIAKACNNNHVYEEAARFKEARDRVEALWRFLR